MDPVPSPRSTRANDAGSFRSRWLRIRAAVPAPCAEAGPEKGKRSPVVDEPLDTFTLDPVSEGAVGCDAVDALGGVSDARRRSNGGDRSHTLGVSHAV